MSQKCRSLRTISILLFFAASCAAPTTPMAHWKSFYSIVWKLWQSTMSTSSVWTSPVVSTSCICTASSTMRCPHLLSTSSAEMRCVQASPGQLTRYLLGNIKTNLYFLSFLNIEISQSKPLVIKNKACLSFISCLPRKWVSRASAFWYWPRSPTYSSLTRWVNDITPASCFDTENTPLI